MLALQLALAAPLMSFAVLFAEHWKDVKLNLTIASATSMLGGAALGWVFAGKPPVDKPPSSTAYRVGGAVLGVFVFTYAGFAAGVVVAYLVDDFDPAMIGGLLGMLLGGRLGYVLAK